MPKPRKSSPSTQLSATIPAEWRVHSPRLLQEIADCSGHGIYRVPLNIFGKLLAAVGERAAELNDPKLNALMCRLTIYSVADPDSPDYSREALREIDEAAKKAAVPAASGPVTPSPVTEDDRTNLRILYDTVLGGGVAGVSKDDAQRLESLGLVKLQPPDQSDRDEGEPEPDYSFTLTEEGESLAQAMRAARAVAGKLY